MSNIGPLTTTFTAPSDCNYISVELVGSSTTYYNYVGKVWPSALRCFPSGYPNAYSDRFSNYYSPGVCPSGWKAYPTSDFPDPAETTALCCPPGFITTGANSNVFASSFPCFTTHIASTPATALVISGSIDIATKTYGDNPSGLITSTNFVMQATGWSVFGMQVRYRSADFLPHNSTTTTSSSGGQANATFNTPLNSQTTIQTFSSYTGMTQSSSTASPNDGNSTLSNGAKIGIGIGVPLVIIILGMIVAFVLIRRRRQLARQQTAANETGPEDHNDYDEHKAELPGNKLGISGGERYAGKTELAATDKPVELEDPSTDWPLPSHHSAQVTPVDVDAISSAHGTAHSDMASGTGSLPETSWSYVPGDDSTGIEQTASAVEENVKYRHIDQEPKVKKQSGRREF